MKIRRVNLVYFSGTGTTRTTVQNIATAFDGIEVREHDLTDYDNREDVLVFDSDELVIFGMPVYGGRVPMIFREFKGLEGEMTPAVCVAVYGNRYYGDAVLEMKDIVESCGMKAIAAGAFVAEHCLNARMGEGRPDGEDAAVERAFGLEVMHKLRDIKSAADMQDLKVAGEFPYKKAGGLPIAPEPDERCVRCGVCARLCPVGVIDKVSFKVTDIDKCIFCQRCVRNCPEHARGVWGEKKAVLDGIIEKIEQGHLDRKAHSLFL